jgi:hypothetical protein
MWNVHTRQRTALAQCAPELPEQMPPALHGKPIPLSREVEPHCEALFNEDPEFRAAAASVNAINSPNQRLCFDDRDMAAAVKEHAKENGGNPRILNAALGILSSAVKRCMTRRGLGRATGRPRKPSSVTGCDVAFVGERKQNREDRFCTGRIRWTHRRSRQCIASPAVTD